VILKTLLNHDIFRNYEVIAGEEGIERGVESVNIMDAPDILNFIKPGELLLTNGYFVKDRPDLFIELVRNMNRMGCPGLAVKTKRFSLVIPEDVLAEAKRLRFPIIEISAVEHSLGEILQQSTSIILDNRNYELQYSLSIHKQFSTMILNGGGVSQIIETLAQLLSSPVLLVNHQLQISVCSLHFQAPDMHAAKEGTLAAVQSLPALTAPVSLCVIRPDMQPYRHMDLYPVFTFRHEGYIAFLQESHANSNLYTLALEQASNVIGMELIKLQAVRERSRRYKNEFFSDLIDGFISSEQEAIYRGRKYGLKPHSLFQMIALKKDDEPAPATSSSAFDEKHISKRDELYGLFKRHFSKLNRPFTIFTKNDLFGLLLAMDEAEWDGDRFLADVKEIAGKIYAEEKFTISVGVGNPVTNVLDIGLSYGEAAKALQTGYQMNKRGFIQAYKSNDISYLLRLLPYDEMEHFYEETFECFASLPDGERRELMRTLKVYYDNHCQLLLTAKQLFIHRNTVIYRLERCEKLTQLNLKDPAESLRFRIAFAMEPFLHEKGHSPASALGALRR